VLRGRPHIHLAVLANASGNTSANASGNASASVQFRLATVLRFVTATQTESVMSLVGDSSLDEKMRMDNSRTDAGCEDSPSRRTAEEIACAYQYGLFFKKCV